MMSAPAIYWKLSNDSSVTAAAVGGMSPAFAPQISKAYPQLVYDGESAKIDRTFGGASGLRSETVKIACAGTDFSSASNLAQLVRNSLDEQSGTWGGIAVLGCFYQSEEDHTEDISDVGPPTLIYITELEFKIWFNNN